MNGTYFPVCALIRGGFCLTGKEVPKVPFLPSFPLSLVVCSFAARPTVPPAGTTKTPGGVNTAAGVATAVAMSDDESA